MSESPENATNLPAAPPPATSPRPRSQRKAPPLFTGEPPSPAPETPDGPSLQGRPDPPAQPNGSASESPGDASQKPSAAPRASSVSPTDRRQLKKAIKAGIRTVGARLNALADEVERDAGLWLADDQDQEGVAEPASSLIARRSDLAMNPDVADLLALLIAAADYISRQLDLKARIRRAIKSGAVVPDAAAHMTDPPATPPTGAPA